MFVSVDSSHFKLCLILESFSILKTLRKRVQVIIKMVLYTTSIAWAIKKMDYTFHDYSKGISSVKNEYSLLYHPHGDGKCHSAHNIPEASQQPKSLGSKIPKWHLAQQLHQRSDPKRSCAVRETSFWVSFSTEACDWRLILDGLIILDGAIECLLFLRFCLEASKMFCRLRIFTLP